VAPVGADQGVNWKAVDPNIATVSDGIVTAKTVGKTDVVATSKADSLITGEAHITVTE